MTAKIENINTKDKDNIKEIIIKVERIADITDIETITKSLKELISDKITKISIEVVKKDVDRLVEQQQNKLSLTLRNENQPKNDLENSAEKIKQDKLSIFKEITAKVIANLENNNAITTDSKITMQNSINEITSSVPQLTDISYIEKITASMKELTTGKIEKGKLLDLKDEINATILMQTHEKANYIPILAVTKIIYDNPLLSNPKLLQAAAENKLSSDLIQKAINNNEEELILAGLMSVGYDITKIN
ncbi:MAG TPA: hypothetical protein LFW14_00090 [Rickettsia endosymbiont of Degeeriella rufa]|nr:hypothetical protein [Rickettsia endosymbiont of Degeeriella rufa]